MPVAAVVRETRHLHYNEREASVELGIYPPALHTLEDLDILHPLKQPRGSKTLRFYPKAEVEAFAKRLLSGQLLRISAVADHLGVSDHLVMQLCKKGWVESYCLSAGVALIFAESVANSPQIKQIQQGLLRTCEQAASELGRSAATLSNWAAEGLVTTVDLGEGCYLIPRKTVDRIAEYLSDRYVGLCEAAQLLGVNKATLWKWSNNGRVRHVEFSTRRYPRDYIISLRRLREERWLTSGQAALLLSTTREEIWQMTREGVITPSEVGGKLAFPAWRIEELLERATSVIETHTLSP